MRWLVILATGGALAGGAVGLGHGASPGAVAAVSTKRPAPAVKVAASRQPDVAAQIRALIAETNTLQTALGHARRELAAALSRPGGKTVIYKGVPYAVQVAAPATSSAALAQAQAQLASEAAALTAERAQLASEQAQLVGEQTKLSGEASQLASRQAALEKEAAALAAEAKALASGGTGPTGGTGGDGGGGDH